MCTPNSSIRDSTYRPTSTGDVLFLLTYANCLIMRTLVFQLGCGTFIIPARLSIELKTLNLQLKTVGGGIKNKQDSCDLALHFQGIAPADYDARMKCSAQFESEIPKCRAHYDQKIRKCDAIRIIPEKTAKKTSTLSKKSQWEELVPSDKLSPGWEEFKPSDAHLYGEEATFVPNRKRDRKTRKDQKGGPADNWKQWEEGNLPGNEMGDMGIDRKGGDMPSLGDSGPKF